MSPKKIEKKKNKTLKNIQSLVPKNLDLNKLKINPFEIIDETKEKIGSFYKNLKKKREKEKHRADKKENQRKRKIYKDKKNKLRKIDQIKLGKKKIKFLLKKN